MHRRARQNRHSGPPQLLRAHCESHAPHRFRYIFSWIQVWCWARNYSKFTQRESLRHAMSILVRFIRPLGGMPTRSMVPKVVVLHERESTLQQKVAFRADEMHTYEKRVCMHLSPGTEWQKKRAFRLHEPRFFFCEPFSRYFVVRGDCRFMRINWYVFLYICVSRWRGRHF